MSRVPRTRRIFFDPYHRKALLKPEPKPVRGILARAAWAVAAFKMGIDIERLWGGAWGSQQLYSCDVAVIGSDPLLNAAAVANAVRRGRTVLLCRTPDVDPAGARPYSPEALEAACALAGVPAERHLDGVLENCAGAVVGAPGAVRLADRFSYNLATRRSEHELMIYLSWTGPHQPPSFGRGYRRLVEALPVLDFEEREDVVDVLFVREIVLTSYHDGFSDRSVDMAPGYAAFVYPLPDIHAMGSADAVEPDAEAYRRGIERVRRALEGSGEPQ